jgi:hypothetical protein
MTTSQRLSALAPVLRTIPELGGATLADLRRWVQLELGSVDALDGGPTRGAHRSYPIAPAMIYLVGANNLEISSFQIVLRALVLGSQLTIKLPTQRRNEILRFIRKLPSCFRQLIQTENTLKVTSLRKAEVVIVLGRDETVNEIRALTTPQQRFTGYGHKLSLIHLTRLPSPTMADHIARDVSLYDQAGCLSPQTVYFPPSISGPQLAQSLATSLSNPNIPRYQRTLLNHAQVQEARDIARAQGETVWGSPHNTDWTVILSQDCTLSTSCGFRVLYLRPLSAQLIPRIPVSLHGRLSSVGSDKRLPPKIQSFYTRMGVSRFCPVGQMQFPPLTWHHDGRGTLSDLVHWVDDEFSI